MGKVAEIVKPPGLRPGATIGIAAPASPFDLELFGQGLALVEGRGYRTLCPEAVYARRGYLAGDDRQRAAALQALFVDPQVGAIFCARGGFGSMRLLAHLDFEPIKDNPKILVGFSDVTALSNVLFDRCGLVGFHGPVVTSLADTDARTSDGLFAALDPSVPLRLSVAEGKTLTPGTATAPLCGGNLTTLCHLVGTPFAPSFDGKILLLEDVNEAPYRIDRMLSQMRMAGCFDGLAGLVLGTFNGCGSEEELKAVVEEVFAPPGIPILSGLTAGHGPVNLTVPIGLTATLNAGEKRLFFHEPATTKA